MREAKLPSPLLQGILEAVIPVVHTPGRPVCSLSQSDTFDHFDARHGNPSTIQIGLRTFHWPEL